MRVAVGARICVLMALFVTIALLIPGFAGFALILEGLCHGVAMLLLSVLLTVTSFVALLFVVSRFVRSLAQ